jgi:hypothetical protein
MKISRIDRKQSTLKAIRPWANTALVALAILGCQRAPAPLAGGASSTEVGSCGIEGTVVDSLNRPLPGSLVRLRPFDYIPTNDSTRADWAMRNVASDRDGRYKFDTVTAGRYNVEALFGESLGQVIDVQIDSAETLRVLPVAMLMPLVAIEGSNIPMPPEGGKRPEAHAIGVERSATIDSMGHFTLNVPSGWTRLALEGVDTNAIAADTIFFAQPGAKIALGPPPQPPPPPKPCDSLSCDLLIVREILEGSGLAAVAAESVIVVAQNRVVELNLRSRGIRILPRAVGKLERLRKLDVGGNLLDTLPSTLGHLRHLDELFADSNSLWKIPATIGMIGSLQKLDLSTNFLLSIPEPITYLRSLEFLNVSNNMLCNIGEMTAEWLDRASPGWRLKQLCQ